MTGDGLDQVHSATPLPIGTRLGTFEVTGVVHRDLSGIVYAGEDRLSPGKVAIKEYLPATLADRMASGKVGLRSLRYKPSFQEGKERFLSNGRMLAALDEPALIRVLRCWKQNGTAYMAMPLYEGQTLNEALRTSARPSEAWLKAMLGPLLDALATLHRFDCYPCNVTPDNIVMLQDGTPLLFAFGAGRRTTASASADLRHDLDPGFAPIEQYAHDPTMPEGPWTDIYAVAAVVRFAITGKPLPALASRMASDALQPLRETHADEYSSLFLNALDRGVAVLPRDRPQTIAEFRKSLGVHQLRPGAHPIAGLEPPSTARSDASPSPRPGAAAPATPRATTKFGPVSTAIPAAAAIEGTRAAASKAEQIVMFSVSPDAARNGTSQHAMQSSPGGLPWKLALQLAVVGLFALGVLVWVMIERRPPAPTTAERATTPAPVASVAQPASPPAVTGPVASEAVAPPPTSPAVVIAPPAVDSSPPAPAQPSVTGNSTPSNAQPAQGAPATPPLRTGKVAFSVKPWGEVIVDGKSRGVSPPLKELSIPEGKHRIQIKNGDFPGYDSQVDIKPGSKDEIAHSFKAP